MKKLFSKRLIIIIFLISTLLVFLFIPIISTDKTNFSALPESKRELIGSFFEIYTGTKVPLSIFILDSLALKSSMFGNFTDLIIFNVFKGYLVIFLPLLAIVTISKKLLSKKGNNKK